MAELLRAQGNIEGMRQLEGYWNDLYKTFSFNFLEVVPSERFMSALQTETALRKRAEKALTEAQETLKAVIQAREEFISIASHELKTPLTALMLQLELQKRRLKRGSSEVVEKNAMNSMIEMAERQTNHLNRLIDDLLDSARMANGNLEVRREDVDLGILVRTIVKRFADEIKTSGSTVQTVIEPVIVGSWDRRRIEQVVSNLLSNAIKYGEGRSIEISVTRLQDTARLAVSDEGKGIAGDSLDRVFDRFERAVTADHIRGLGLRLYISRKIIEMHEGHIWAESVAGKGSTFLVTLPTIKYS